MTCLDPNNKNSVLLEFFSKRESSIQTSCFAQLLCLKCYLNFSDVQFLFTFPGKLTESYVESQPRIWILHKLDVKLHKPVPLEFTNL